MQSTLNALETKHISSSFGIFTCNEFVTILQIIY